MSLATAASLVGVLADITAERKAQDKKWGEQNHPDGTGSLMDQMCAEQARHLCDVKYREGIGTWKDILREEYAEAMAESNPVKLREELIQVAAVAAAWVEAIDRRESK